MPGQFQNALLGMSPGAGFGGATPPLNALLPPDPNQVTPAQGWEAYAQPARAVGNWMADQRAQSAAQGLLNPRTGLPTRAGVMNAVGQWTNALLMGTTEPGAPPLNGLMSMGKTGAGRSIEMASKSPMMYNLPVKPQRPDVADYPNGAAVDASGRYALDMDGRPLTAPIIAGRSVLGTGDSAVAPAELNAVAEGLTGSVPAGVAPGQIGNDAGRYRRTAAGSQIDYNRSLAAPDVPLVIGHEVGHAIDEVAGQIPVAGLDTELRRVYNAQNNPQTYGKPFGPEQNRYKAAVVPRELMAEAIRGYMADPNAFKTMAPNTAATIRDAVNAHPVLSKVIQFNSVAPVAGVGLAGAAAGQMMQPPQDGASEQQ